jgi:ABC-2 type transport system permease protein/fluoroquinolone transport system permease protein
MPVLGFLIVLMAVTVRFVLAREWRPAESYYFVDQTEGASYESVLREAGTDSGRFLSDEEALRSAVRKNANSVGVLFTGPAACPKVTIVHSGRVSAQGINVLKAALNAMMRSVTGGSGEGAIEGAARVRFLRPEARPVPPNLTAVPGLLSFEVVVLGFVFVAVFIFQEKREGTIRAYRVSPGGASAYVISKTLVFSLVGTLYGCGLLLATMGTAVNYGVIVPLLALGAGVYTLVGISVASFFEDLSEWFLPAVLLLVLNMIPAISMVFPVFSPGWLQFIPSYPVTAAIVEVLFPSGRPVLPMMGTLLAEGVAAYAACAVLTERNLMREGGS